MMNKPLQAFREWAMGAVSVGNPNAGNTYKGQCVSLIQQYLNQVFGVPYAARGNAKDYVPPGFTRLAVGAARKPGDIIRYGKNYGAGYGHIAMIDDEGMFLDQNGTIALKVARRASPFSGIESVWRPNSSFTIKNPTQGGKAMTRAEAEVIAAAMYRKLLKREPDAGGLANYTNHILAGNADFAFGDVASSQEFRDQNTTVKEVIKEVIKEVPTGSAATPDQVLGGQLVDLIRKAK